MATSAEYDVRGINKEGLQPIKDAINAYKSHILDHLSLLDSTNIEYRDFLEEHIHGEETRTAMRNYFKSISDSIKEDIFPVLDNFSNKLDEVLAEYELQDRNAEAFTSRITSNNTNSDRS